MHQPKLLSGAYCVSLLILLLQGCHTSTTEPSAQQANAADQADKPFYQTLEPPPAPVLKPDEALATFVLPEGYNISLVAAEPLLEDPVAADWDELGNLYVAEMRAYMPNLDGSGEEQPIGAIVRLSDTDGDGAFDRREELINDLVLPRAVRIINEGMLVAEMGKLWLCPSASGWSADISCENKQFLGEYGVHQGSVEHAENGLLVGIDGWMYSAKSSRRIKLEDGKLIEQPTAFRGQWGIAQDNLGRLFYNTNSNLLLGDYYDAHAIVAAGNSRAPGLNQRISPNDEVFSIRVNPGVNRAYLPGVLRKDGRLRSATSASGMVIYRGGVWGDEDPNAFVAEPAANLVAAFSLDANPGNDKQSDKLKISAEHQLYADEQWGQRDFLASTDERFRPVDVMNGPDGALYVLDFYRGVIQDHVYLSEQLKAQAIERGLERPVGMGRIWRVAKADQSPIALPDFVNMTQAELVQALAHPNHWVRATAHRLLVRSDVSADLLPKVLSKSRNTLQAVHAVWVLANRDDLTSGLVSNALQQSDLVAEAALLAGGHLLSAAQLQSELERLIPMGASRRLLYTVAALRPYAGQDSVRQLLVTLLRSDNPHTRIVVASAFRGDVQSNGEGEERAAIAALLADWDQQREAATGMVKHLTQQFFRAEGAGAQALLDDVMTYEQDWAQRAVLDGLFETTRDAGFERAQLNQAHPLFAQDQLAIWPAIARARQGFTWAGDTLAAAAKPLNSAQQARMAQGATLYASSCANCHGADGAGVGAAGPPLKDSQWVTSAPERLVRIVLDGVSGPIDVLGETWNSAMPGHKNYPGFDDEGVAGLLTWLRRSWGHAGRAIEPEFVAAVRSETAARNALWTADELNAIDLNTHYRKYAGAYGAPGRAIQFTWDGKNLILDAGFIKGPLVEEKEDHFVYEPRAMRMEFVLSDSGTVKGVGMNMGDGINLLPKLPPAEPNP